MRIIESSLLSVPLIALAWGCVSTSQVSGGSVGNSKPAVASAARGSTIDPKLREELVLMSKADQEVRQALIAAGLDRPNEEILAQMTKIDSANSARMKSIIRAHG